MNAMSRVVALSAITVLLAAPLTATAGQGGPARRGGVEAPPLEPRAQDSGRVVLAEENARETRDRLARLLQQYPTTLAEVLRRDPTLLRNDAYLAPYPSLAAFLTQHPEVAHNPAYFLGSPQRDYYVDRDPASQRTQAMENVFSGFMVLVGLMSLLAVLGWVTKALIDSRRWARLSKLQTEAHTKVIDRLTSNEDLLAYVQTPAGRRYLESAPLTLNAPEGVTSAPYSRILWSVQAGTVAAFIGLGFLFVSRSWADDTDWSGDFSRMLLLAGVVALAAGAGFVLSGFASYALSKRFGLINSTTSSHA
jgi:hypothetical protein